MPEDAPARKRPTGAIIATIAAVQALLEIGDALRENLKRPAPDA